MFRKKWFVLEPGLSEMFWPKCMMGLNKCSRVCLNNRRGPVCFAQCKFLGQVQLEAQAGYSNRRMVRAFETSRTGLLFSRKSGFGNILILARSGYPLAWILALTNASHFWLLPGQHTNVTRTTIRNWLILLVQLACPLARSGHSWPGPETHRAVKLPISVNFGL